ncbi:hypothetical protein Mx9_p89 [Myxococcus phage Mx9]|nr:hypothetical protein Mx9_p89 [Myxococcus phage Mx9]
MTNDFNDLLQQMTPEELEQLIGLGTLDERQSLLDKQMAQAEALMQQGGGRYSTPLGAALGGLAGVGQSVMGTKQQQDAMEQQRAILGQKDVGRGLYTDVIRRQQQAQQPWDVTPAIPFSF